MSNSTQLGWLMQEARKVRIAYQHGEISFDERIKQLNKLTKPSGFWAHVSQFFLES